MNSDPAKLDWPNHLLRLCKLKAYTLPILHIKLKTQNFLGPLPSHWWIELNPKLAASCHLWPKFTFAHVYISVYTAALSICLTNSTVPPACRINDQLLRKFSGRTIPYRLGTGLVCGMKTKSYGSPAASLSLLTNVILMFIHKSWMHMQAVRSPLEGDASQEVMLGSSTWGDPLGKWNSGRSDNSCL